MVMLSPATLDLDRPLAVLVASVGGWAQRTAPLLIEERSEATLVRGHGHPFVPW